MKTIKDLTVSVTYTVSLENVKVPDRILRQLDSIYDNGGWCSNDGSHNADGVEWLCENIEEQDACEWEYKIDFLNIYDNIS
jgi:hypothetical protein